MSRIPWDVRIERAGLLAARLPASHEILSFYQRVLVSQASLYQEFVQLAASSLAVEVVERYFPPFVDCVQRGATSELVERSAEILSRGPAGWQELIEAGDDFFARAFLQPLSEVRHAEPAPGNRNISTVCPCCGHAPQVAVLRELQHGARRDLVCSRCSWEWEFRRIICPACAEDRFEKLAAFRSDSFSALRIESCETCSTYLLAADLTVDGTVVPLVDEVAAVSLHLWAGDQGLRHLQPNLLGL